MQDYIILIKQKKKKKNIQNVLQHSFQFKNEPWHVISNNVAFCQVYTQTSLCSLLLSLQTPNVVRSVGKYS